jgi:hypothetical protein
MTSSEIAELPCRYCGIDMNGTEYHKADCDLWDFCPTCRSRSWSQVTKRHDHHGDSCPRLQVYPGDFVSAGYMGSEGIVVSKGMIALGKRNVPGYMVRKASGKRVFIPRSELRMIARA